MPVRFTGGGISPTVPVDAPGIPSYMPCVRLWLLRARRKSTGGFMAGLPGVTQERPVGRGTSAKAFWIVVLESLGCNGQFLRLGPH